MNTNDPYLRMDLAAALHLAHHGHILAVRPQRPDATQDYAVTGPDKNVLRESFTRRLNDLMDTAFADNLVTYDDQDRMVLTDAGKLHVTDFYGRIDGPGPKPVCEPMGAYGSDGWTLRQTVEMRRDELEPGNIVHSSHGIRFQVEAVYTAGAVTQIWNGRHGYASHSERYDSAITIPVECESLYPQQDKKLRDAGRL